jgi:hypothetical protein
MTNLNKKYPALSVVIRVLKVTFKVLLILFLVLSVPSCASSKKNPYYEKRLKASRTNTNQLGRNRYYFSKDYQKKLGKSYKRK